MQCYCQGLCKHHYLKRWREQKLKIGDLRSCKESGCDRLYFCKGFCKYHYEKVRATLPEVKISRLNAGRKYDSSDHGKQHRKQYRHTLNGKAASDSAQKKYKNSEHGRKKIKEYSHLPEVKIRNNIASKKYRPTEKGQVTQKKYKRSEHGRKIIKAGNMKRRNSPQGKLWRYIWNRSQTGKDSMRRAKNRYYHKNPDLCHDKIYDPLKFEYLETVDYRCEWSGCNRQNAALHHALLRSKFPELKYTRRNFIAYCPVHHFLIHFLHYIRARRSYHRNFLSMLRKTAETYCSNHNFLFWKIISESLGKKYHILLILFYMRRGI